MYRYVAQEHCRAKATMNVDLLKPSLNDSLEFFDM
jgi:hypothetical protein